MKDYVEYRQKLMDFVGEYLSALDSINDDPNLSEMQKVVKATEVSSSMGMPTDWLC